MGFVSAVIAFIVVFAIGMGIRYLVKKSTGKAPTGGKITIQPQINIGQSNAAPPPAVKAAFCPSCGAKLDGDSAFCGSCGAKVG